MKQKWMLSLALMLSLVLVGCGATTPPAQSGSSTASTSCQAQAPEQEGKDVTDQYQEQLVGCYDDENGDRYTLNEDGSVRRQQVEQEDTAGTWWVWQENGTDYLYIHMEETAHPAAYTFDVSENGITLFDDTTGELSNLFTPATCGVYP